MVDQSYQTLNVAHAVVDAISQWPGWSIERSAKEKGRVVTFTMYDRASGDTMEFTVKSRVKSDVPETCIVCHKQTTDRRDTGRPDTVYGPSVTAVCREHLGHFKNVNQIEGSYFAQWDLWIRDPDTTTDGPTDKP